MFPLGRAPAARQSRSPACTPYSYASACGTYVRAVRAFEGLIVRTKDVATLNARANDGGGHDTLDERIILLLLLLGGPLGWVCAAMEMRTACLALV